MQIRISTLALAVATLALTACDGSDQQAGISVANTHLTYHLVENGCDTQPHTFGDHASYCQGLRDDRLNRGCAEDLRRNQYAQDCNDQGPYDAGNPGPTAQVNPSTGDGQPTITPHHDGRGGHEHPEARVQVIEAHLPAYVQLKAEDEGDQLLSTWDGRLQIDTRVPGLPALMRAREVQILQPEPGECQLTVKQFTNPSADGLVGFTLMGLDNKATPQCLAVLTRMEQEQGFEVEFRGIPGASSAVKLKVGPARN